MKKACKLVGIITSMTLWWLSFVSYSHAFQQQNGQYHPYPFVTTTQSRIGGGSIHPFSVSSSSCRTSRSSIQRTNHKTRRISSLSRAIPPTSSTQLQLSTLVTAMASPVGALGILALIVLVHEAGHYGAARWFGIQVEEFSIGFGPKLVGFTAGGNEWNLRALPLGGFVRFPENYDVEKAKELNRLAIEAAAERRKEFTVQDKAIDALTLGWWDEQKRLQKKQELLQQIEQEQRQMATTARNWWQQPIFLRRRSPAEASTKPVVPQDPEEYEIEYYDNPDLLQNRSWIQRAVVLSAGVFMNLVLAFSIYFGEIGFGSGIPQPVFEPGVVVTNTPFANSASMGILQKGDIIIGVNGMCNKKL